MTLKNKIQDFEYIKNMVDIIRNPSLILNAENQILFANNAFKKTFQIKVSDTKKESIFEIGEKQLNIAPMIKLLKEIIPKNKFFDNLKIHHTFPFVGEKIFLVNCKKINEIIFLTMEDITINMTVAKTLADFALIQVDKITNLEKDINKLKKQTKFKL